MDSARTSRTIRSRSEIRIVRGTMDSSDVVKAAAVALAKEPGNGGLQQQLCRALFLRFRDQLTGFAVRALRRNLRRELDDIVLDSLSRLYVIAIRQVESGRLDVARTSAEIDAYFRKTVFRMLRRQAQTLRHRREVPFDDKGHETLVVDLQSEIVERNDFVAQVWAQLSSDEILLMSRYFWGMTSDDIAKLSGMQVNTVRSRVFRLMKRLREHFAG